MPSRFGALLRDEAKGGDHVEGGRWFVVNEGLRRDGVDRCFPFERRSFFLIRGNVGGIVHVGGPFRRGVYSAFAGGARDLANDLVQVFGVSNFCRFQVFLWDKVLLGCHQVSSR